MVEKTKAYPTYASWGTAASPALHKDRLFIVNDNEKDSFIAAYDAKTGNELWRNKRDERSAWATPYVWENPLRTEIVTCGPKKSARTTRTASCSGKSPACPFPTIPTPVTGHGMIYVSSGFVMDRFRPIYAVKPGASGNITLKNDQSKTISSPGSRSKAGRTIRPRSVTATTLRSARPGLFTCYDAKTGKQVYDRQRLPQGRAFTASPWASGGKLFCLNEYGVTYVIEAGPKFKLLAQNNLDDMCMASPAIAGDRLLIRTAEALYCIRND